jgi:hypothetical protein
MSTWHTLASARAEWRDAPRDDSVLQGLLDTAKQECQIAANLALPDPEVIPAGWRIAQLLQMRAIWTFQQTATQDDTAALLVGIGGTKVYPMDGNVRQRLRPHTPIPGIG